MEPLISVIVPIYNTEKYLDKCLLSIINQTFNKIEVICVDDCSPDNSYKIVEEFSKRDSRVKLVRHKKNLGLGGARNTAIKLAKAEYIASVDSDDYIDDKMLEKLWQETDNGEYDIVCCGFERVDSSGGTLSRQTFKSHNILNKDNSINIFAYMNPAFWNKLWRRSLYVDNDIYFPNYVYYQDMATTPRVLAKAKKIKIIDESLYYYLIRDDSATYTYSAKHLVDYIKVFEVLKTFLHKENLVDRYRKEFLEYVDRGTKFHSENVMKSDMQKEELTQYLRQLLMMKIAFLENFDAVIPYDDDSLLKLIRTAQSKADILPDDANEELGVSLIVKTFLRPKKLEQFLLSVGEYEEKRQVRFNEILVGDDSSQNIIKLNKRAIQKAIDLYPSMRIKHLEFDEYIGTSMGRNLLVDATSQEYVFLCDDDFLLDEDSDIRIALDQLTSGQYDLIGGWLKNNYNVSTGSSEYWGSCGTMVEHPKELKVYLDESEDKNSPSAPDFRDTDYLLNFFVSRRKLLKDIPWDEKLKTEEHPEFFYRLFKSEYKAAYGKHFYAKHDSDRRTNPEVYNRFRFQKTWEKYLHQSVRLMGKEKRTFHRWNDKRFLTWSVDSIKRTCTQTPIDLREPILSGRVDVKRLTPKYSHYFFGYYDVQSVSDDGSLMVCQTAPAVTSLPVAGDVADIVIFDLNKDDAEGKVIGQTAAWCHQQGAHTQFLPSDTSKVIFNTFDQDSEKFGSKIVDTEGETIRVFEYPISAISKDGLKAISLNFSRLYDYRPGYGYGLIPDKNEDIFAPEDDGVFYLDLESGEAELLISYERLKSYIARLGYLEYSAQKIIVNHVAFNTTGSKLLMLVRTFSGDAPFPTFTLVYDFDSQELKKVFGFCSHYHWKDEHILVASGSPNIPRKDARQINVYEVNTLELDYELIGEKYMDYDGHCSYSPDRTMMLYDSYSNPQFPYRRLQVYHIAKDMFLDLGYFYSEAKFHGNNTDLRCDLHPRWSPDGKTITFDSLHEGFRGVYQIEVADVVNEFSSQRGYLGLDDLQAWYKTKYLSQTTEAAKPQQVQKANAQKSKNVYDSPSLTNFQKAGVKTFVVMSKPFVSSKKIKKLETKPHLFFQDAKGSFPRYIGRRLKFIR